jgi:CRP-like cAMP-binding protein
MQLAQDLSRAAYARALPAPPRPVTRPPEALPRLFRAKEMVFLEGERADVFYYVLEGAVRLLRTTPDGRRQLVGFACRGDWLAIGTGETYSHTAESLRDSRLKPLTRAEYDRRMRGDAGFVAEMMEVSAATLRQAEELLILLGQRSALEKLASFLLGYSRRAGAGAGEFRLPMDRTDIADYLGLTIETVSRKFTQLKRSGVIELPIPACVQIRDRAALETIAAGGEGGR